MKPILLRSAMVAGLVALWSWTGLAQAATAPAQVAQVFACTLADGQTGDNAWALMDALRDNVGDDVEPEFGMFVWVPYRGPTDYDFVFGVITRDLNSMAEGSMAYAGSSGAAAIGQRFQTLESCDSAIMMSEQITEGRIGMTGGDREVDAVVETFSCRFHEGSSRSDFDAAVEFWRSQVDEVGSSALDDYQAYLWTPFRGSTGETDIIWIGNSPDLTTWAQGASDYAGSEAGRAADARFAEVASCGNQLWMGYWIVAPENF